MPVDDRNWSQFISIYGPLTKCQAMFQTLGTESESHSVMSDSLWPHGLQPARLLCPRKSPGQNTGVGSHSLLQGIFPTQGSNPGLPHCRRIHYQLNHQGSPREGIKTQPFNCKLIQPLWKIVWRFLKKLGMTVPYQPTIPLLGIHPEETIIEKDTCTPMFIAALFTIARTWKQPRCPLTDECVTYTQWNITQP